MGTGRGRERGNSMGEGESVPANPCRLPTCLPLNSIPSRTYQIFQQNLCLPLVKCRSLENVQPVVPLMFVTFMGERTWLKPLAGDKKDLTLISSCQGLCQEACSQNVLIILMIKSTSIIFFILKNHCDVCFVMLILKISIIFSDSIATVPIII